MRLRLDLAYDGTDFHGWAAQPSLRTVQGELEKALATVLRMDAVQVTCAGRTDTGVHARGQVVHLDVHPDVLAAAAGRSAAPAPDALTRRLNGVLPVDVRVHRATEVPDAFDARFSALWRRYAYRIADAPELVDPLVRTAVLAWPRSLDLDAMNAGGEAAHRRARLRGVLPQARRCDHDPHAARAALGPGCFRPGRGDRARRRVLPQHGACAGRLPRRSRRGTSYAGVGR